MTPIRFEGLATSWFTTATNERRMRYSPRSFARYLRTDAAGNEPILFDHWASIQFPRVGKTKWTQTSDGLRAEFALDPSKRWGRELTLAVLHGHVRHMSIGANIVESRTYRSGSSFSEAVHDADLAEVSVTDNPAIKGTWIRVVGHPLAAVTSWPRDPADKAALVKFLHRCGLTVPDFAPTVSLGLVGTHRPQRYGSDVWKTLHPKLVGFLKAGVAFDATVPLTGGKRVVDLLTEPQRQAMLDMILAD